MHYQCMWTVHTSACGLMMHTRYLHIIYTVSTAVLESRSIRLSAVLRLSHAVATSQQLCTHRVPKIPPNPGVWGSVLCGTHELWLHNDWDEGIGPEIALEGQRERCRAPRLHGWL